MYGRILVRHLEVRFNKVLMFELGFNNQHNTLWGKLYTAGDVKIEWHGTRIFYHFTTTLIHYSSLFRRDYICSRNP
jgi:hypothetical protein